MTSDRRHGGRALRAIRNKPPADSPAGLLATIYKSAYPEEAPTPEEQLRAIATLRQRLDEEEQQIIFGLRLHGATWQSIADIFGTTRQNIQQRFTAAATDKLASAVGKEPKP